MKSVAAPSMKALPPQQSLVLMTLMLLLCWISTAQTGLNGIGAHFIYDQHGNLIAERGNSGWKDYIYVDKVTHYETRIPQTNPQNPNPWQLQKRVDLKGDPHYNKTTKQDVPTPHVHDPSTPGGVRPANPEETPR